MRRKAIGIDHGTVGCRKQKEAISMEIPLIKLNLKKKWPTIQAKIYLIEKTQSGAFIYLFWFFFFFFFLLDSVCLFAGIKPHHSLEYRTVWLLNFIGKNSSCCVRNTKWRKKKTIIFNAIEQIYRNILHTIEFDKI